MLADPFHEEVPRVRPAGNSLWDVVTPWSRQAQSCVLGTRLSAREAAALVAANVPAGNGPAIEGGWPTRTPAPPDSGIEHSWAGQSGA
ncbi:DUF6193 family natural product biosynthesis protein [Streptomyces sp. NPDC005263]|uniref:DUF6193 family natural product biosynthesis protein n=1 Tax=Streptomyces sp. NPDC005263 TaxID=3364711 RepID=UPI0036BCC8F7